MGRARGKRPAVPGGVPTEEHISLDEQDNAYSASVDAGHLVDERAQKIFIVAIVLLAVYFIGLIIPKDLLNQALHEGGYNAGYSFAWFVEDFMANVAGLVGVFTGNDNGPDPFSTEMIRYIVIALTGAGLALCGAVYQGSFKNALVSPSTLGVTSGATLGMMLWVVFYVNEDATNVTWMGSYVGDKNSLDYLVCNYSLSFISFAGCMVVVAVVLLVLKFGGKGGTSAIMLIIAGQVVGSVMGAVSNSVRYYYIADNPYSAKSSLLTDMQVASFYRTYTWIDIVAIGIPVALAFFVIFRLRRRMTMLSFSQGEARSMGVDTTRMQRLILVLCTLLTAILISFCGQIGFVGFLVPHIARRLVGPAFEYLLPAATAIGAVFVLGAYVLLEVTLGPDYETMVGMYISIAGATVFLITAIRGKGGTRGQFE